jgi:hypothetical protein
MIIRCHSIQSCPHIEVWKREMHVVYRSRREKRKAVLRTLNYCVRGETSSTSERFRSARLSDDPCQLEIALAVLTTKQVVMHATECVTMDNIAFYRLATKVCRARPSVLFSQRYSGTAKKCPFAALLIHRPERLDYIEFSCFYRIQPALRCQVPAL